ncbi:MAG: nitronate monooxygenase [Gammaproteobacteria bacterium]|nr:nitronate monooxygenase [Gammaproteobacteria bacterium]MBQ0839330.1 nitronate monooxygenase [Gammaproteobacteria bacterium]
MILQERLDIELPIIQAPMAGVQDSTLAIAVSKAGGLGSLPCAMLNKDDLLRELATLHAQTNKPFNLNFFCHTPPPPQPEQEAAWRKVLTPYYQEFGLDINAIVKGLERRPFSTETADLIEAFKPAVVSFHFGLPEKRLLARVKSWGSKIIASATTVEEALFLEAAGVDAIIAQGLEAGGHRGNFLSDDLDKQLGTFALIPQIVKAVKLPVIAAGGIVDTKTVAAAMALGAAGVQAGTAYLLCPESTTSALHRAALTKDSARHTTLTNIFSGRAARGIVNRAISELGPINPSAPVFPLASTAIASLRTAAEKQGRANFSPLWCGQNASGCKETSAAELTRSLTAGL